ncbi:MAG: nucleoside triphosphate pyrophosphohydrolase [Bacilli bacterium]
MEKIYNKLVRDNIPDIIKKDGETPVIRILSDDEYKKELYKKLLEECNELISAKTKDDIIEEASDIFEVLSAISELEGRNIDKVIETSSQKRSKRGGFTKRIFLVKSTKKD